MNIETTYKQRTSTGVYYIRSVRDEHGTMLSNERVKRDPVLVFTQPATATLADTPGSAVDVSVTFRLHDFDGEARTDSGPVQFRLYDRSIADDEGVAFTREVTEGEVTLTLEIAAAGEYVITIEPPLLADMQLVEPLRVRVV